MKKTKLIQILTILLIVLKPLFSFDTLNCIAHFEHIPPMTTGSQMLPVVLGDINADGYDDWAFKYRDRNIYFSRDSVYLYMGSDSINFTEDYKIQAREFGNVGDINGDSYDDIAYMSIDYYALQMLEDDPVIKILYGGPNFDLIPDDSCKLTNVKGLQLIQFEPFNRIGDINGDGYDDLCYGPREYSGAFLYKGSNLEYQDHIRLSIYLGGDDLSWMPDTTITPPRFLLNSDSHGYDWYNCTGLGDINHDGYDDFSMQYFEICIPASGAKLCDSVMYVYYGNNDLSNIINSVDTLVVGDIRGELGKISDVYSKAFFCQNKDTLEQIPGMNIVYGNDMNAFVMHYNKNDIGNITPGDINNDGYNDWIIWDNNDAQIKGYFGGSQLDNEFDFITPDAFVFNCGTENEYYDKESNFYILGDICGDGFDKILFTEKIDDQYYDLYCFSYNEVKTRIKDIVPESYELLTIYPNPFNPTTTIEYHLSTSGNVDLSIYNVLGMKEVTLFNNTREVGSYNLQFNAQSLGSGIYLCVLQVNNEIVSTKKLLLMK